MGSSSFFVPSPNFSAGAVGEANVIGDMGRGLAMFALARMDLGCGRGNW
jgi:hypothetical protein